MRVDLDESFEEDGNWLCVADKNPPPVMENLEEMGAMRISPAAKKTVNSRSGISTDC